MGNCFGDLMNIYLGYLDWVDYLYFDYHYLMIYLDSNFENSKMSNLFSYLLTANFYFDFGMSLVANYCSCLIGIDFLNLFLRVSFYRFQNFSFFLLFIKSNENYLNKKIMIRINEYKN